MARIGSSPPRTSAKATRVCPQILPDPRACIRSLKTDAGQRSLGSRACEFRLSKKPDLGSSWDLDRVDAALESEDLGDRPPLPPFLLRLGVIAWPHRLTYRAGH